LEEPFAVDVDGMPGTSLYPLRFQPIYQYRLWGGRRLANLLSAPLPDNDPIGEAWVLSDRVDHPSRVANGPLEGRTIGELIAESPEQMLGILAGRCERFPLLLKFLDVRDRLSVQVHPSDSQRGYLPAGETGKTEAWVVLDTGPDSRIYAGLKHATTERGLRHAIANGTIADDLASFTPRRGDIVFVKAGTVHSLRNVVVFEAQQNSDVTFRLYDWDHVDPKTGRHRELQVEAALDCISFPQIAVTPIESMVEELTPVMRERLFQCKQFGMSRVSAESPFIVGAPDTTRVLACIAGDGAVEHNGVEYPIRKGDVMLLPAIVGACSCRPRQQMTVLEISLPEDQ
jgi:mannose-6-phosphate isomerase